MALPIALDRTRERRDTVVVDPGCMTSPAAESARVHSGEAEYRFPIWWKRPFFLGDCRSGIRPPDPNACLSAGVISGAHPIARGLPPPTMPGKAFFGTRNLREIGRRAKQNLPVLTKSHN